MCTYILFLWWSYQYLSEGYWSCLDWNFQIHIISNEFIFSVGDHIGGSGTVRTRCSHCQQFDDRFRGSALFTISYQILFFCFTIRSTCVTVHVRFDNWRLRLRVVCLFSMNGLDTWCHVMFFQACSPRTTRTTTCGVWICRHGGGSVPSSLWAPSPPLAYSLLLCRSLTTRSSWRAAPPPTMMSVILIYLHSHFWSFYTNEASKWNIECFMNCVLLRIGLISNGNG